MSEEEPTRVTIADLPLSRARDLSIETATVAAACAAGVFRGLLDGSAGPDELAGRVGLDRRAAGILLPVLAELGLLERTDGRYALTPAARRCLADPDARAYEAGGLPHWLENLRAFTRLPEVLAHGGPLVEHADDERMDGDGEEEGLARFMAAMAAAPEERLERLVGLCTERLRVAGPEPPRLLDVGGGPGHMSRAFVDRGFRATLFDRPGTVDFVADEYGLAEAPEIELVGGDFVEDPLPSGPFDVVLMSNVAHIYGPETNRRVVEKVAGVTRAGGVVAVADFFRGRSARAARFALTMLLRTEEGDTYPVDQVTGWLAGAGLGDFRVDALDEDRHLITAVKPADAEGGER